MTVDSTYTSRGVVVNICIPDIFPRIIFVSIQDQIEEKAMLQKSSDYLSDWWIKLLAYSDNNIYILMTVWCIGKMKFGCQIKLHLRVLLGNLDLAGTLFDIS